MVQDLKYAFRTFGSHPGFTAVVVLSISLGIAANSTVFSMVSATLLGALPVHEPDRLVSFDGGRSKPYLDYLDYRAQTRDQFQGIAAYFPLVPASVGGGQPERVWGQLATANYFRVLDLPLSLGRGFLDEEETQRTPVVVLGNGLWKRRFGADPRVLGRQAILNGRPYTIIGVAPPEFRGEMRMLVAEFWVPLSLGPDIMPDLSENAHRESRNSSWLTIVGRLKPGVSRQSAQAAVNAIQQRLDLEYRKDHRFQPMRLTTAGGLPFDMSGFAAGLMGILMVVVAIVLLIACANVANLLLARAASRQREIGIRLAVGAGRTRLVRQLLTESVMLSVMGSGAGLLLAWAATRALSSFSLPIQFPIRFSFSLDGRVLAFTAALSLVTGILFGLAPALRATRPALVTALKTDAPALGGSRRFGMRNLLVVAQVALSLVLLIAAGLFLRSLQAATSIDIGFRTGNVLLMGFDPKLHHYSDEKSRQFLAQLRQRVTTLPGVRSMSFVDVVPLSVGGSSLDLHAPEMDKTTNVDVFRVGSRYFETMGIPLLRGRDFSMGAGAGDHAILNEIAAQRLFPGQDPLGRQVKEENRVYQVIGVVGNTKSQRLGEGSVACFYQFMEPDPNRNLSFFGTAILVKTAGNPKALVRPVRAGIEALDRNLAVYGVETMQEHIDKALLVPRLSASLFAIFGVVGLSLATVGLYGVMSYSVRRRTREIGIRMALGASTPGVLRLVARQGLALAAAGLAIGLAIALPLSRFAASLLYGSATDLSTFLLVPALLLVVALIAIAVPARRAARVDPWSALRYE